MMLTRFCYYLQLARFDRPAGTLLLLWPTLWGLWAVATPPLYWVLVFVAGVVVMRAFGCVVNDLMDVRLDRAVARTRNRPLAAGVISRGEAVMVGVVLALLALALWWLLPPVARGWSVAALLLAIVYPLGKHWLAAPQLVLGVAFSMGILIADVTLSGQTLPRAAAWCLFVANALWVVAYDTIYAMADKAEDAAVGTVGSTALLFGSADIKVVSVLYAVCVLWLSLIGLIFNYGVAYQVALVAAMVSVLRFWQKYKTRDERACMAVFRANHWFGLWVFAGLAAAQH